MRPEELALELGINGPSSARLAPYGLPAFYFGPRIELGSDRSASRLILSAASLSSTFARSRPHTSVPGGTWTVAAFVIR